MIGFGSVFAVVSTVLVLAARAAAVEQPIDAVRIVLKRTGAGASLAFVTRDPDFLFPPVGSADDPGTGSPGGMTVELFSASEGSATLAIPAGSGNPGWTVNPGPADRYRFKNQLAPGGVSPVRSVFMREGKVVTIKARSAGLPLLVPQGTLGIRITTGSRRTCAFFDASTVRRDEAGRFTARNAVATALPDCSDASMERLPCQEIFDPVEPTCGGVCPAGERCVSEITGEILPTCVCLPETQTACNGSGYPTCGGSCTAGAECQGVHLRAQEGAIDLTLCLCVDPANACNDPAGTCFEAGVCPAGLVCNADGPPDAECSCGAP
jgi:hypothetical protein